jgi:hypothetical protein
MSKLAETTTTTPVTRAGISQVGKPVRSMSGGLITAGKTVESVGVGVGVGTDVET